MRYSALLGVAVGLGLVVQGTAGPLSERLVVTAGSGAFSKLFLVRLDGRDWQRVTDRRGSEAEGVYSAARHEVYYRGLEQGDWELFAWSLRDRRARRLTAAAGLDHNPRPSPDGKWLAYATQRYGTDELMLQSLEDPDSGPRRLTFDQSQSSSPSWSPDGRRLVYSSRRNGQADLYLLDLESEEHNRLTVSEQDEVDPRWSPDGSKVLFQTTAEPYRRGILGWIELPARKRVELTDLQGSFHEADWSPDGQRVVCLNYYSERQPRSPQLAIFSIVDLHISELRPFQRESVNLYWNYRQVNWAGANPSSWWAFSR